MKENPTCADLLEVLRRLRSPEGCPWDRKQTRESLRGCLAGETAELLDAIDDNDVHGICEESGDVLMNLMMQALVAEERGEFTFDDSVREIYNKMIRRHPHVFGGASATNPDEVVTLWEDIKRKEKSANPRTSLLDGVPRAQGELARACSLQKKAAKAGFDWDNDAGIIDKITEELTELREALASNDEAAITEEIGDLLFAVTNIARFRGADAELILKQSNAKFIRRFQAMERFAAENGEELSSLPIEKQESLWQRAKQEERQGDI